MNSCAGQNTNYVRRTWQGTDTISSRNYYCDASHYVKYTDTFLLDCGSCKYCVNGESSCRSCTSGETCDASVTGSYGSCTDFSDACDTSGTQYAQVTNYVCTNTGLCGRSFTTASKSCTRTVSDGTDCGICAVCDTGSCGGIPSDDSSCGTIDCDGKNYYYQSGTESATATETCYYRDYADITSNRCEGFNDCKDANSGDCTGYSDSSSYTCGTCKYISSSSCTGSTRGSCSDYNGGEYCGTNMKCVSGSCVQDKPNCPSAQDGTTYAGCRLSPLPSYSHPDSNYYCPSSYYCAICDSGYTYSSSLGRCVYSGTSTACSSFSISPSHVNNTGIYLTVSGCTSQSPLSLHYDFSAAYGNGCTWTSNHGPTSDTSKSVTFTVGSCASADNKAVSFTVNVYNDNAPGYWSRVKDTYVCLNPNQDYTSGYGCCWKNTGTSCDVNEDCCGTNICSSGVCCLASEYWDGSRCSSLADESIDNCNSAGGIWDGTLAYYWTNGNPRCVLDSTNEYRRKQAYYTSSTHGTTLPDIAQI